MQWQILKKYFGERFQNFNQVEVQALVTADVESFVDNARMRQITGQHAIDIIRVLQGLVAKKALMQEGQARWLSRKELAELLDRNSEGLRSRFLVSMVEHGLLRLRYPDKPNRVDQAYTSIENKKEEMNKDRNF